MGAIQIHMLLQVEVPEGTYLADVGFGNLAPRLSNASIITAAQRSLSACCGLGVSAIVISITA